MIPRIKITNKDFSILIVKICEMYGYKTLNQMYKAVSNAKPTAKFSFDTHHYRAAQLVKILDRTIEYLNYKKLNNLK